MLPTTGRYPFKISFLPHEVCVDPELQVNLPENLFINQIKRTAFPLSHSPPPRSFGKNGNTGNEQKFSNDNIDNPNPIRRD